MQNFVSECSLWISSKATLHDSQRQFSLNVYLYEKSLQCSYLQIKEENAPNFAFIPINNSVIFDIKDDTLEIYFVDYGSQISFDFSNPFELEMIVSHISKSVILCNMLPDQFSSENLAYLETFPETADKVTHAAKLSTTILTPINSTASARSLWEENILRQNTQFYIQNTDIRFSFLTWNVAGHKPTEDVLADIVKCFKVPTAPSDIIIIAFQEIDMGVKSVVTGNSNLSDKWTDIVTVAQNLFGESKFDLLVNESCGSVYCAALARKDLNPKPVVGEVQQIKLGAGGIFANKAAILIPIKIGHANIMAVACHLAPHEPNVEERNEQWRLIARTVGDDVDYFSMMGDLNYRLTLDYDSVVEKAQSDQVNDLLEYDQLKNSQKKCKILEKFKEADIRFRPTYKFDKNCDVYDTSPKHRTPSYTDRILIRTGTPRMKIGIEDSLEIETDVGFNMMNDKGAFKTDLFIPKSTKKVLNFPSPPQCICYRSLRCTFSDHRPVHAAYKYTIPVVNEGRLMQLKDIIEEKFNEIVVASVPKVAIEPEKLVYAGEKSIEIEMANTSLVWVNWSMRKAPAGVHVSPQSGRLYSQESTKISIAFDSTFSKNEPILFDIAGTRAVKFNIQVEDE